MNSKYNRNIKTATQDKTTHVQVTERTSKGVQVHEVNLAHVQLPTYSQAQIKTSARLWVEYGDNNLFPDFLISCIDKSSRHSAYLNFRENAIKGGKVGITYSDNVKEFLENVDGAGLTVQELVNLWAINLAILETFGCFVRYNKKNQIAALDYIDSSKIRVAKPVYSKEQMEAGLPAEIEGYYVCDDWDDILRNKPVFYPKFQAPQDGGKPTASTQLFYYRKKTLKQPYYPSVSYSSCLNHVLAQEQLALYGLNTLLNGFFMSSIIHMVSPGMDDEQQTLLKRKIDGKFTGAENNGKSLLLVTEDEKATVDIKPLTVGDNTPLIEAIRAQVEQAIDVAHRCRPELIGVPSNGGLASDGTSIGPSMEIYQNNVINALQAAILDFLRVVLRVNGFEKGRYELDIAENVLVKELSPQWFEQANIKRESLARKYGWKDSDLIEIPSNNAPSTTDSTTGNPSNEEPNQEDKAVDDNPLDSQ